jgi:hypothetical protein
MIPFRPAATAALLALGLATAGCGGPLTPSPAASPAIQQRE